MIAQIRSRIVFESRNLNILPAALKTSGSSRERDRGGGENGEDEGDGGDGENGESGKNTEDAEKN